MTTQRVVGACLVLLGLALWMTVFAPTVLGQGTPHHYHGLGERRPARGGKDVDLGSTAAPGGV